LSESDLSRAATATVCSYREHMSDCAFHECVRGVVRDGRPNAY
jgi:hypothetical protein